MEGMVTKNGERIAARFTSEARAATEATRLNAELGRNGGGYGYKDVWVEIQLPDGSWTVEYREEKLSWPRRLWRGFWDSLLGW